MGFRTLPKDLQNLISDFGWEITTKQLDKSLQTCLEIKSWKLHPHVLRRKVWCSRFRDYVESPLVIFRPISWFRNCWKTLFDWCTVTEILHRLDFRKRAVKRTGTRSQWVNRLRNWRRIRWLSSFFSMMMDLETDPFKPTFKTERFDNMKWVF